MDKIKEIKDKEKRKNSFTEEDDFVILESSKPTLIEEEKPKEQNKIESKKEGTLLNSSFRTSNKEQYIRIQQYEKALDNWNEIVLKNPVEFRSTIRCGIPQPSLRAKLWKKCTKSENLSVKYPNLYSKLVALEDYFDLGPTIRKDIHRTFPQYEYFSIKDGEGQKKLFNVLKAVSFFDREVGYVQGLAFITGFTLLHFNDEEETFWFVIQLLNDENYLLKDLFKDKLTRLFLILSQIQKLVEAQVPKVHQYFEKNYIIPEMYAAPFILTLLTNRFPYEVVERIWDIFLYEGWKQIIRTFVGFLKRYQDEILNHDPLMVVNYLYVLALKTNVEEILEASFSIKITNSELKSMEQEYLKNSKLKKI